jgi:uncharacterized membrane protein
VGRRSGGGGGGRGGLEGGRSATPWTEAGVPDASTEAALEAAMAQVSQFRLAAERAESRLYDEYTRVANSERRAESITLDLSGANMRAEVGSVGNNPPRHQYVPHSRVLNQMQP